MSFFSDKQQELIAFAWGCMVCFGTYLIHNVLNMVDFRA